MLYTCELGTVEMQFFNLRGSNVSNQMKKETIVRFTGKGHRVNLQLYWVIICEKSCDKNFEKEGRLQQRINVAFRTNFC